MASDDPDRAGPAPDLWREPARRLNAWAERSGAGATGLLSLAALAATFAFLLLWNGHYILGILAALIFIPVELAGHGERRRKPSLAGIAAPILWWWAWWHGLHAQGQPLTPVYGLMVLWTILGASTADAAIHWLFERRFGGLPLRRWRWFDSRFDLVAAGPAINLALLAIGAVTRRPAVALIVAAWWALASALVHAFRLAQAGEQAANGERIAAWNEQ